MKLTSRAAPWLIVIAALLWAADAPFRKFLTTELPSDIIVLSEHILIGLIVLPTFIRRFVELKQLRLPEWLAVLVIGVGGSALATVLFTQAFHYVNPSVAILLQKTQPFIAILLAYALLKEKLVPRFYLWAVIGVVGAYLISFPDVIPTGVDFSGGTLGVVFALGAAFLWGASTVMGKLVLKRVSAPMMTSLRFLVALVFLAFLAGFRGELSAYRAFTIQDGLAVAIIALLAGWLSLTLYYRGLAKTRASISTIAELAFPFAAVIVNWIFLDAALAPMQLFGGLILLLAITRVVSFNPPTPDDTAVPTPATPVGTH